MAKPNANVDYSVCDPQKCGHEKCPAAKVCKHKVLKQEAPGEPPVRFGLCEGCAICVVECPLKAIRMI